jgi:hypothetical protein
VESDRPYRAAHADQGSEIDEAPLEPFGAVEAAVDQAAVEADRMAGAQRHAGGEKKDEEGVPGEGEGTEDQRGGQHPAVPQRSAGIPEHLALDRAGGVETGQRIDLEGGASRRDLVGHQVTSGPLRAMIVSMR